MLRRAVLLALALFALLALAACGSSENDATETPAFVAMPVVATQDGPAPSPTSTVVQPQATTPPSASATPPPATAIPSSTVPAPTFGLPNIADLIDRVKPSVVSISVEVTQTDFLGRQTRGTAAGSGFIFDPRGYILTNNHVVENASRILLTMDDTRRFEAELIGRDPLTDLAVIKFTEDMEVPALPLADSDELRIGEWVVAIGNALGLPGEPTVTVGVVGAKSRTVGPLASGIYLHNMLQTDAAINPGNSGGPLIDLNGRVVGINSAIIEGANGIGFSIAANTARAVAEQLVEHGKVVWPWLGISANDVTPQVAVEFDLSINQGVLVLGIEPGGPAGRAGMRVEDVILRLGAEAIPDTIALQRATRQNAIGATVEVVVLRDGREVSLSVTLEEMPRPQ